MKINVLNLEKNKHGITELKREGEVVGRYIISKYSIDTVYKFTNKQLATLKKSFTELEIDELAVKLGKYFQDNPDSGPARINIDWVKDGMPDGSEEIMVIENNRKK